MMVTKIQKWGNSLALRIPKALAEEAGLEQGKPVDVRCVRTVKSESESGAGKRYDLDELLASVPDDYDEGEWDTGPAVGSEVWW